MNSDRDRLIAALLALQDDEEDLRDLDAKIGDGDLGFTVAVGARAVAEVLQNSADAPLADQLKDCARAFGSANPSTFAALIQAALLRASKTVSAVVAEGGSEPAGAGLVAMLIDSAIDGIATRGKTAVGDKTVLDPLAATAPLAQEASAVDSTLFSLLAEKATAVTKETAHQQSRKGRAAWLQERSAGLVDPGSAAYGRFLNHLAAAWGN